ncbi:hypothetical protein [Legionella londiniensis]|uniref:Uncharacterized protein n=1 Tax=Legionella londiniensis TaxID=45068 RepID=A0A0W0VLS2_9GAMM|nr:hypothetical protein [Legionella londiniensis]KTD21032.1 hypothetical protein Llon_1130 [Legionella londiniensis]STX93693.1 Uncharacterised protein [Legionella londiniensis]
MTFTHEGHVSGNSQKHEHAKDKSDLSRASDIAEDTYRKIEEKEKKAGALIKEKLIPLIDAYLNHLKRAAGKYHCDGNNNQDAKLAIQDSDAPDYQTIAKKHNLVLELKGGLTRPAEENLTALRRIKRFETALKSIRQEYGNDKSNGLFLSEHRSGLDHFIKTCLNILFVAPIGIYELCRGRSVFFFSKPHGRAFVEEAEREMKLFLG